LREKRRDHAYADRLQEAHDEIIAMVGFLMMRDETLAAFGRRRVRAAEEE
jgi:hypothetical protein